VNKDSELSRREFMKLFGSAALSYLAASNFSSTARSSPSYQGAESPNVLILLFDALSARHMSLYGYSRETTPHMARFAERSLVYHNHYACGNFTSPATASLLTGVYPWRHRAINLNGIVTQDYLDKNLFSLCRSNHITAAYTHNPLAGIFLNQFSYHIDQLHEMRNLSLAGEVYAERIAPENFPVAFWSETILRGTDQFIPGSLMLSTLEKEVQNLRLRKIEADLLDNYPKGIPLNFKGMHILLEDAIDWIMTQLVSYPRSFLAYYHLWPPHDPYLPRAEFINLFADGLKWPPKPRNAFSLGIPESEIQVNRQQYDEYVAFVDSEFGRLIDFMEQAGLLENTMVVLTSDHGELFERGLTGHLNSTLYQSLIQVPLLISLPNQAERQDFFTATSCVDLLPTLLAYTGGQIPDFIEGQVLPGFEPSSRQGERSVFALEAKLSGKNDPFQKCTLAMIKGRYKLIRYRGYPQELADELYDLENDAEEMENLASTRGMVAEEMGQELQMKIEED
jgi:arylsulfatase A-like enzyme